MTQSLHSPPASQVLDADGQERNEHNEQDHLFQVLVHPGNGTEIKPGSRHSANPEDSTEDIVAGESTVRHLSNASHHRRKGPREWDKAGKKNSLAAVLFIELLCVEQVLAAKPKVVLF